MASFVFILISKLIIIINNNFCLTFIDRLFIIVDILLNMRVKNENE
jgi:hypothetical protein